ncbi:MAG: hypothetical protein ACR2JB_23815 [Bryobacteraceae bacterium]
MKELNLETQFILSEAQESGDPDIALKSIARLEKQLELEARLLGELNEQTRIAIGINRPSAAASEARPISAHR